MNFIWCPSPNFDERPPNTVIDTVVLHYTDMKSAALSLERLCDPLSKVSAHYLIDEDGTAYQLVLEEKRAWHAGVSQWRGRENVNHFSIGIELQNPGYFYFQQFGQWFPYSSAQYQALVQLLYFLKGRYPLIVNNTVGHNDVAPQRKIDPGPHFNWEILQENGFRKA